MSGSAPSHPPLYRTLFRDALSTAWHNPHLWLLGFFAALLQTGGIYDVLLRSFNLLADQAAVQLSGSTSFSQGIMIWATQPMAQVSRALGILGTIGRFQDLLLIVVLLGITAGASIIAQGALAYGLGIRLRGKIPSLSACLNIGGKFFWKTAMINVVTLGLLWFFRILVVLPFSTPLEQTSVWTIIASLVTYLLYIVAVVALTATHMFALNSLVLQKYSVAESLARGFVQIRKAWLMIIELGFGFFLLGFTLFIGLGLLYLVAGVPLLILTLSAALLNSSLIATLLNICFFGGALLAFILLGSFATTLQYAAWQGLAMRMAQGTALAWVPRWFAPRKRS